MYKTVGIVTGSFVIGGIAVLKLTGLSLEPKLVRRNNTPSEIVAKSNGRDLWIHNIQCRDKLVYINKDIDQPFVKESDTKIGKTMYQPVILTLGSDIETFEKFLKTQVSNSWFNVGWNTLKEFSEEQFNLQISSQLARLVDEKINEGDMEIDVFYSLHRSTPEFLQFKKTYRVKDLDISNK